MCTSNSNVNMYFTFGVLVYFLCAKHVKVSATWLILSANCLIFMIRDTCQTRDTVE